MTDTDHESEKLRLDIFRRMSPARRLAMAAGWSTSLRQMSRAALKQQHQGATDAQLQRLFANRWLGPELAAAVYPTPGI